MNNHHSFNLSVETEDSFSSLLELAAENDVDGFRRFVARDPSAIDEIGLWYMRKKKGSNQMVHEQRTPLMVAATYGSVEVLETILSFSGCDVNKIVGAEQTTALHCAASGGSKNAVEVVKILIAAGADARLVDADGRRAVDAVDVPPNTIGSKIMLEEMLGGGSEITHPHTNLLWASTSTSSTPLLSSSPDEDGDGDGSSPSSADSMCSARKEAANFSAEKKEYPPIDPLIPDIKNSIYASDEFRMFSFKVRPCSRAYSHDWTECPFVHPGENARRRDPRKYHYSCVPCPDFRKGACRRGDLCEYAHGVFECWLHPAQYRTRLCKDGIGCARRVCFFAHTSEELRPLYVSTGSAVPSPRSMEMSVAAMSLMPGLPNHFTPPVSPSGNAWQQQSVPTLHLPGSNNGFQSSRLRSSLTARDMMVQDQSLLSDFDAQYLNEYCYSPRLAKLVGNRSVLVRSKALNPSNLDEQLFSSEISSSPLYGSEQGGVFSPSQKSPMLNQFNPINAESNPLLHASLGIPSPNRMSPRGIEQHSPFSSRISALRSLGSRELGSNAATIGSPMHSTLSNWGSRTGKLDWGVNREELGGFNQFSSKMNLGLGNEDPDVSWVQPLVSPPEIRGKLKINTVFRGGGRGGEEANNTNGEEHAVHGAWLEQMQLDQLVV